MKNIIRVCTVVVVVLASMSALFAACTLVSTENAFSAEILFALRPTNNGQLSYYSYNGLPDLGNFGNRGNEKVISPGWNIYNDIFHGKSR